MRARRNSNRTNVNATEMACNKSILLSPIQVEVLSFLLPLSTEYPGIQDWYINKVLTGERDGTRRIVRIYRDNKLVALGIGKREKSEKKICTVRVLPEYSRQGIGSEIFHQLIEWIGESRPLITVSGSKASLFEPIFQKFGFQLTSVRRGLYAENSFELFYNEPRALAQWTSHSGLNNR
jgi:GNAT superfamily N-acetyltransferase